MQLDIGEDKAKELLSDIGYFRFGFYCFPFETSYPKIKNRTHQYKQGTKISDVVKLYDFDVDLRNILSKYINRIEINFRTNIIYRVSAKYIDCNTWFVDPMVMEKGFIDNFDKMLYTDKYKKNPIIKRHHAKYLNHKYAPAWKTLEFFTFGTILTIYKNLKDKLLKQQIASQYKISNEKVLENYFKGIVAIRNVCAHGGVLFDHKIHLPLRNGPALQIDNRNKNKIYSVIQIMSYILKSISQSRADAMDLEIRKLFDDLKNDTANPIHCLISKCIGYDNF